MFDPELWAVGLELGGIYMQRGINKFSDWATTMRASVGGKLEPWLRGLWTTLESMPENGRFDAKQSAAIAQAVGARYERGMTDVKELASEITRGYDEETARELNRALEAQYLGIKKFFAERLTKLHGEVLKEATADNYVQGVRAGNIRLYSADVRKQLREVGDAADRVMRRRKRQELSDTEAYDELMKKKQRAEELSLQEEEYDDSGDKVEKFRIPLPGGLTSTDVRHKLANGVEIYTQREDTPRSYTRVVIQKEPTKEYPTWLASKENLGALHVGLAKHFDGIQADYTSPGDRYRKLSTRDFSFKDKKNADEYVKQLKKLYRALDDSLEEMRNRQPESDWRAIKEPDASKTPKSDDVDALYGYISNVMNTLMRSKPAEYEDKQNELQEVWQSARDTLRELDEGNKTVSEAYSELFGQKDEMKRLLNGDKADNKKAASSGQLSPRDAVRERLRPLRGQPIINKATGIEAQLGTKGINKMVSNAAVDKSKANGFTEAQHLEAAENIKQLYEEAQLTRTEPDKNQKPNVLSIKRFHSDTRVGGEEAVAKITVKESIDAGHRIYSIELEELNKPAELKSDIGHSPAGSRDSTQKDWGKQVSAIYAEESHNQNIAQESTESKGKTNIKAKSDEEIAEDWIALADIKSESAPVEKPTMSSTVSMLGGGATVSWSKQVDALEKLARAMNGKIKDNSAEFENATMEYLFETAAEYWLKNKHLKSEARTVSEVESDIERRLRARLEEYPQLAKEIESIKLFERLRSDLFARAKAYEIQQSSDKELQQTEDRLRQQDRTAENWIKRMGWENKRVTKPFSMVASRVDGIMAIGFPADAENSNEAVGDIIRLAKEMGGENPSNRGFEFRDKSTADKFYETANYFLSNRHLKAGGRNNSEPETKKAAEGNAEAVNSAADTNAAEVFKRTPSRTTETTL